MNVKRDHNRRESDNAALLIRYRLAPLRLRNATPIAAGNFDKSSYSEKLVAASPELRGGVSAATLNKEVDAEGSCDVLLVVLRNRE